MRGESGILKVFEVLHPSLVVSLSRSKNCADNGFLSRRMSPPALCKSVLLVQARSLHINMKRKAGRRLAAALRRASR